MYQLGSARPVRKELIPAAGDRPAVAVTFNPQPSALSLRAARRAVLEVLRGGGPDADERAADAYTAEIIRHNLLSWEGIGDTVGEPVEPTGDREVRDEDGTVIDVEPGTISAFLAEPRLVEAADREYVLPWALADAENNGSSLSPNGTSAGAMPEADTASSPATQDGSADAGTQTDTPPAPMSGTKRRPKKAKQPGS